MNLLKYGIKLQLNNMKDIAKYEVEVGKDAVVPEVPVHVGYVFTGWYDFENQSVKVTNFKYILEDLHVLAKYSRDANGNGIPDDEEDLDLDFDGDVEDDVDVTEDV